MIEIFVDIDDVIREELDREYPPSFIVIDNKTRICCPRCGCEIGYEYNEASNYWGLWDRCIRCGQYILDDQKGVT